MACLLSREDHCYYGLSVVKGRPLLLWLVSCQGKTTVTMACQLSREDHCYYGLSVVKGRPLLLWLVCCQGKTTVTMACQLSREDHCYYGLSVVKGRPLLLWLVSCQGKTTVTMACLLSREDHCYYGLSVVKGRPLLLWLVCCQGKTTVTMACQLSREDFKCMYFECFRVWHQGRQLSQFHYLKKKTWANKNESLTHTYSLWEKKSKQAISVSSITAKKVLKIGTSDIVWFQHTLLHKYRCWLVLTASL